MTARAGSWLITSNHKHEAERVTWKLHEALNSQAHPQLCTSSSKATLPIASPNRAIRDQVLKFLHLWGTFILPQYRWESWVAKKCNYFVYGHMARKKKAGTETDVYLHSCIFSCRLLKHLKLVSTNSNTYNLSAFLFAYRKIHTTCFRRETALALDEMDLGWIHLCQIDVKTQAKFFNHAKPVSLPITATDDYWAPVLT